MISHFPHTPHPVSSLMNACHGGEVWTKKTKVKNQSPSVEEKTESVEQNGKVSDQGWNLGLTANLLCITGLTVSVLYL